MTKLETIRDLIDNKDYAAAKAILVTIDHPASARWIAELDKRIAERETKLAARRKEGEMVVAIILVIVVAVALLVAIAGFSSTLQAGRDALHAAIGG